MLAVLLAAAGHDLSPAARPTSFWVAFCPLCEPLGWWGVVVSLAIVLALVGGVIAAAVAIYKGQSAWRWFALGVVTLGVAAFAVAGRPQHAHRYGLRGWTRVPTTPEPTPCPCCGATNHPSASQCSGCGSALEPEAPSEATRTGARPA